MIPKDIDGNELRVGDRVICLNSSFYRWAAGYRGTIVHIYDKDIGIEWDETIRKMSNNKETGHNCSNNCKNFYGWYINITTDLIQLEESYEAEHTVYTPFTPEELDLLLS